MTTYHTPSPSTSPSPSPPRSHRPPYHDLEEKPESLLKSSLVFLGSVAAAALCAHRFWPKGFTYGDREDWEVREELHHRTHQHHGGRRGGGEDKEKRQRQRGDRGARREGYRRRSSGLEGMEGGYPTEKQEEAGEEVVYRVREKRRGSRTREGSRGRDRSKDRSRERSSDRGSSRHSERGRTGFVRPSSRDPTAFDQGRAARKERRYYPPAPQRHAIDRGGSTSGRRSSADSARSRNYYYHDQGVVDERQAEPVYARRELAPRSRRSSVDDGTAPGRRGRSRYSDDLYYGE